ncbi:MAG: glycosyltransferase family 2 protein, partial [Planctomycetota bacterium]
MIDVLIQTFNEEKNLPHTLETIMPWARDSLEPGNEPIFGKVFVIDSHSTDRTIDIVNDMRATPVVHTWEGYARQKNWALRTLPLTSPWTLILDADEALTPELRQKLHAIASTPFNPATDATGYLLNRLTYFQGEPLKHSGYYPSWNLRFFRRGGRCAAGASASQAARRVRRIPCAR